MREVHWGLWGKVHHFANRRRRLLRRNLRAGCAGICATGYPFSRRKSSNRPAVLFGHHQIGASALFAEHQMARFSHLLGMAEHRNYDVAGQASGQVNSR